MIVSHFRCDSAGNDSRSWWRWVEWARVWGWESWCGGGPGVARAWGGAGLVGGERGGGLGGCGSGRGDGRLLGDEDVAGRIHVIPGDDAGAEGRAGQAGERGEAALFQAEEPGDQIGPSPDSRRLISYEHFLAAMGTEAEANGHAVA